MRPLLPALAALALAACQSRSDTVYQPPAELVAAYDAAMGGPPPPPSAAYWAAREREAQAKAICEARGEMAAATYSGRGFGMAGAVITGLEAGLAKQRVRDACIDAFYRSNVMPAL